ncbi:unnamed protein product [Aureobasidium vineae]|uniref:Uncharacterized protein n=1 Tax=Aureobasidium vineae TaxID=2773715 RepID=A0A9N8JMW3_9PEZI|nr:unnamed protein product [Aureobasidium vineae]
MFHASSIEPTLTILPSLRLPAAAWYHYLRHGSEPSACPRRCRTRRRLQHLPQNQGSNLYWAVPMLIGYELMNWATEK